jgi:hypothetical protein
MGGDAPVPECDFKKSRSKVWREKRFLLLQNLLIPSKHPQNALSICCCSPLPSVDVLKTKHFDASFNEPKFLGQFHNPGPLLTLSLGFVAFFMGGLLPNFDRIGEREILSWDFINAKTSSAPYARLCAFGLTQWFPKCAPRIPRPVSLGIRRYISVMATLKLTYFVIKINNRETFLISDMFTLYDR